jgi:molybdopterin-guanine dinucleotide biosynthesis adapter protein
MAMIIQRVMPCEDLLRQERHRPISIRMDGTRVIGLAGWSGAGKTTLLAKLIPVLVARGIGVSTVKHASHAFDIDHPGKDSHVHRQAGAMEVLISSGRRFALMHELRGGREPVLAELLARLSPVDLVIVEGFKRERHAKLEVHRMANGKPPLYPDDPDIIGIATDAVFAGNPLPQAGLDDIEAIAALALAHALPRGETLRRLAMGPRG